MTKPDEGKKSQSSSEGQSLLQSAVKGPTGKACQDMPSQSVSRSEVGRVGSLDNKYRRPKSACVTRREPNSLTNSPNFRERSVSLGKETQAARMVSRQLNKQNSRKSSPCDCSYNSTEILCEHTREGSIDDSVYLKSKMDKTFKYRQSPPDVIFDYIHGEIRHRPKTAFGSTIPRKYQANANIKIGRRPKVLEVESDGNETEDEIEADVQPIRVDTYLNQCIQHSQAITIKPGEKAHASSVFSKIMDELMPGQCDKHPCVEKTISFEPLCRTRANSLPVNAKPASILKKRDMPCSMKVRIKLPDECF